MTSLFWIKALFINIQAPAWRPVSVDQPSQPYVPPSNLATPATMAERKVLDLKRW